MCLATYPPISYSFIRVYTKIFFYKKGGQSGLFDQKYHENTQKYPFLRLFWPFLRYFRPILAIFWQNKSPLLGPKSGQKVGKKWAFWVFSLF
jgi:hypothetical protein